MTARSSPHHAAVVRAQVRRKGAKHRRLARSHHANNRDSFHPPAVPSDDPGLAFRIAEGRAAAARFLRDPPKTEEQKASRWRKIWGGK